MNTYALIENSIVINVVVWDGINYDPETGSGWSPEEGVTAVELHDGDAPQIGLGYSDGVFEQPSEPTPPQLDAAQIIAGNTAIQAQLLSAVAMAIAPLQDAADLDEATTEEAALLKAWKQYRVAVNRVDLSAPSWPVAPSA